MEKRVFWWGVCVLLLLVGMEACGETPCGTAGAAAVRAQAWAMFSPEAAAGMRARADSVAGRAVVRAATADLPATPHPVAAVHTEGTLPHRGIRDQSIEAEKDWDKMLDLALAYRLTGDAKFLAAEDCFLGAWAAVYKPNLNPIDETNLDKLMMAYDLTGGGLSAGTETAAMRLWHTLAEGYTGWLETQGDKDNANWSSHRAKLAVLAAYEVGDEKLERRALAAAQRHVRANIRSDGSVEDFYKRDALHYVVYDLQPLEMAALAARAHGATGFAEGKDGKTLAHAVDWLVPFATGVKTHEEFVHSSVGFDQARDKAGEKGYSGQWNPEAGVPVLALAAVLDGRFGEALERSEKLTGRMPPAWMQLYAAGGSTAERR